MEEHLEVCCIEGPLNQERVHNKLWPPSPFSVSLITADMGASPTPSSVRSYEEEKVNGWKGVSAYGIHISRLRFEV